VKRGAVLLAIALLASCSGPAAPKAPGPGAGRADWALAIHGGAGVIEKSEYDAVRQEYLDSLQQALELGRSVLDGGGTSLEAVQRVIVFLEDDPKFNAGRGAVYNHDGGHELDASIMDGRTLACGGVAGVTTVKNPILLAYDVMKHTPHVLLAGPGAERFAAEMGVERVDPHYFDTPRRYKQWRDRVERESGAGPADHGTVGAVALDRHGNLAAATSTGGLTDKRFGRIGDSPIIGAGTYADNRTCAVSGTGQGEEFIRNDLAFRVSALMAYRGASLQEAADEVVHRVLRPGDGGIIAVDHDGNIAMVFNTGGMFRGAADSRGRFEVAIWE
jgi:beta-aspartyl-peptidase (threonine type)